MNATRLIQQLPLPCLLVGADLIVQAQSSGLLQRLGNRSVVKQPLSMLAPADARLMAAAELALHGQRETVIHEVQLGDEGHSLLAEIQLQPLSATQLCSEIGVESAIREQDALFVTLEFSRVNAAQPNALVRQMTRAFAHEIANPLGGLRGTAQLLQRLNPELSEYTEVLIRESDRIKNLIDRLRGRAVAAKHAINIHEPIEQAFKLAEAQFQQVHFVRDYDPSLPEIKADSPSLTQALLNLLINAAQADSKQIKLSTRAEHRVRLGATQLKCAIAIHVEDDGKGVPEYLRDTLFLPLVTGRASGSGFGLATSLAIAEEHGGGLRYRSSSGDTCFTFYLPTL